MAVGDDVAEAVARSAPVGPGAPFELLFDESPDGGPALPAAFRAVYPSPWRLPAVKARPYVYVNFVLSRDGRVSFDEPGHMSGADVSGFDLHDRWLMALLRSRADAVLMGDSTLRVEPEHLWSAEFLCPDDAGAFAAVRLEEGRSPLPLQVFLSREGDIDVAGAHVFCVEGAHVVLATTARGAARLRSLPGTAARVDVLELGDESVDVRALLASLRDDFGAATVLCEGGPRAYGSLLAARCVDDEFLTLSPVVIGAAPGRARPGLVEGSAFPATGYPLSRPLSLHRAGDMLFLRSRYTFPEAPQAPQRTGRSRRQPVTAVDERSSALHELVEEGARIERLAGGFAFVEGPVWHPRHHHLLFSDMEADVRRRFTSDGAVVEVRRYSNRCNGMTYDADLNLIVCEHVTSSVVREYPDGSRETIASTYLGEELNSPNDVVVARDGSIYFSDPWYGRRAPHGHPRVRRLGWQGVFRIPPSGGELELVVDRDAFEMPNGLCFSPDERLLYVDDTPQGRIDVFDVARDGSLANRRVFFAGLGDGADGTGVADGLKCDERGNIWVTGPGGIWVISPQGEHLGVVRVSEVAANLTWGGADWRTLFVTASTSLYAIRTLVGPHREPYMG